MALMQPEDASVESSEGQSIEELFNTLESPLLGYCLRLLGEPGVAEDIVQEAFMRLHAHFKEVREPRKWLYRTVHNLSLNHRRDERKIVRLEHPANESESTATEATDPELLPDEQIIRWEGIGLVRLSLETLDDRSRELVRLKFNEGLSYKQISSRTGLSISNVGYVLHHAIKSIALELAKNGIIP